jgi:hypothetical protein
MATVKLIWDLSFLALWDSAQTNTGCGWQKNTKYHKKGAITELTIRGAEKQF